MAIVKAASGAPWEPPCGSGDAGFPLTPWASVDLRGLLPWMQSCLKTALWGDGDSDKLDWAPQRPLRPETVGSSHRVTLTLVVWTGSEAGQGAPQLPSSSVSGTVCSRRPAESVLKEETSSGRGGERASSRVQHASQGGLRPAWAGACPRGLTMPSRNVGTASSCCRNGRLGKHPSGCLSSHWPQAGGVGGPSSWTPG